MTISNPKILKRLFIIGWIVYFTSYIGRLNYAASMIQIGQIEGYTSSQLGTVVTALFISYGIGQLISGILGDRYSPRLLVLTGVLGCSLCNLFVYFSTSYLQIVASWFLNGFALSLIWSPMLKLFSRHMPKDYLRQCCFNIQTSVALGTFFTYLFCSFMVALFNWRIIFLCSTILLVIVGILWQIIIKQIETHAMTCSAEEVITTEEVAATALSVTPPSKGILLTSGLVIILVAIFVMGFLKDGIMTWVPQYITDTFGTNAYFSIFLSAFLPLINLTGIYAGKFLNDKNGNDDLKTTIIFYIVSAISLILLVLFGEVNILLSVVLFASVTSCMLGINTILISVLPTYFAKYNKISTISGLTNSITYLGSSVCGYGLGSLAENFGWTTTIVLLSFTAVLGIIACIAAKPLWTKFKTQI